MPTIPTYEAPQLGITPTETGIDAFQQAARRVGAFASETGQNLAQIGQRAGSAVKDVGEVALKSIEHHETAAGAKNYADMMSSLMADWTQTAKNADPNDASVAAKWREQVMEPALQKFSENGFLTEGGQQWAQNHVAALRQHMVEKNNTDMSTLAGVAAHANFAEVTNKLASTVHLDPSSLDFALKTADSALGGIVDSSPNLSATDAARVRSEALLKAREGIVKSAVIGMIEKNPDLDLAAINQKYGQYLKPGEMEMFERAAKAQAKANLYYDRQAAVLKKQQDDLKLHQDASKYLSDILKVDPNDPNKYLVDPGAKQKALDLLRSNNEAPSATTVFGNLDKLVDHFSKPEQITTNQATFSRLLAGMSSPDKPTTDMDVLTAAANHELSPHDTSIAREMVKSYGPEAMRDPLVHAALSGASERAGVGLMNDGHQRYSNFIQAFWPEYTKQKAAGILKPNALDFNDPNSLIRQTMQTYEPTRAQMVNAALMRRLQEIGIEGPPTRTVSPQERQQAEDWVKKNPNDPRAAPIKQVLDQSTASAATAAPTSAPTAAPARSTTRPPAEAISPAAGEINAQLPPKTPDLANELSRLPTSVLHTVGRTMHGQSVAAEKVVEAERWIQQQAAKAPSAALTAILSGLRRNGDGLKALAEAQKYLREKGGEGAARALRAFNESAEK